VKSPEYQGRDIITGSALREKDRIKQQTEDDADFAIILEAFKFRGYDKGSRSIQMRLIHLKPPIIMNRKKIQRLMRKYNLYCPIRRANPYRKMAKALKEARVVPNTLNREFKKHDPRAVLLSDITYIPRRGGKYTSLRYNGCFHQTSFSVCHQLNLRS